MGKSIKFWKISLYSKYENNFKWKNWIKSNKWISYELINFTPGKFKGFYIFQIIIRFETNLINSANYHEYNCGRLKIKHRLSGIFITVLSRKYYLIYLNFPHYTKDFTIFRDRFANYPEHWIPIISKIKSYYYKQKLKKIYAKRS